MNSQKPGPGPRQTDRLAMAARCFRRRRRKLGPAGQWVADGVQFALPNTYEGVLGGLFAKLGLGLFLEVEMKNLLRFLVVIWFLLSQSILVWQMLGKGVGAMTVLSALLSSLVFVVVALLQRKPELFDGLCLFSARVKSLLEDFFK